MTITSIKIANAMVERLRADLAAAQATIERMREAQGKQKPVAWRVFDGEGGYDLIGYADNEDYRDKFIERNPAPMYATWVEPLYAAPVVQPDMVMVPREPSEKILLAGGDYFDGESFTYARRAYHAMIAAAEGKK